MEAVLQSKHKLECAQKDMEALQAQSATLREAVLMGAGLMGRLEEVRVHIEHVATDTQGACARTHITTDT